MLAGNAASYSCQRMERGDGMGSPVTVVVINSLSYTGTTWLNLVLGSHPKTFALGPCDRPYALPLEKASEACRVHGEACTFWPEFYQTLGSENFFVHLARRSGKSIIVTNNPLPQGAGLALNHPDVVVKSIDLVRDGRGVAWSYAHKHPGETFYDSVQNWLKPAIEGIVFDPANPDRLCLRYEEVLADQRGMLARVGSFIGVDYDDSAMRFWEHDHHAAAGNVGPVFMIKLHQGLPLPNFARDRSFYEEQYNKAKQDPEHQFESERWRAQLSPRELFAFEYFCGRANARLGYEPSRFTLDEVREFSRELNLALELPQQDDGGHRGKRGRPAEPPTPPTVVETKALREPAESVQPMPQGIKPHGAAIAVIVFALAVGVVSIMAATGVFG
jgi:hypothetical protein